MNMEKGIGFSLIFCGSLTVVIPSVPARLQSFVTWIVDHQREDDDNAQGDEDEFQIHSHHFVAPFSPTPIRIEN